MEQEKDITKDLTPEKMIALLLQKEPANPEIFWIKHKRLSAELGDTVAFPFQKVGYEKLKRLKTLDNMDTALVLECAHGDVFKNPELLARYDAVTPEELLKDVRFLLPGELEEMAQRIELEHGYRKITLDTIKKK